MGSPFFSVVVAAYNPGSRILPTIRSALAQSHRDFEILVVGDGCTDDTGEILARHFGDAVAWHNLPHNRGSQSYPNNAGNDRARGTHIAYLGHDDVWAPQHLARLADCIRACDPDIAVSGAIYHSPPGSKYYHLTGLFDDAAAAAREFFPPSSFAHRRDVIARIGRWRDPLEISAPVDCEFLLRAVAGGCTFASTHVITVHKFAAGHRYLSYRFPSADEQQRALDRLCSAGGEEEMLQELAADLADGAFAPPMPYPDFSAFAPGELYRRARQYKGLERTALVAVATSVTFAPAETSAELDWHPRETHPVHGPFRWSGPNPNPLQWLPVRIDGAFHLLIDVVAVAAPGMIETLALEVNDMPAALAVESRGDGTHVLRVEPRFADSVTDGLKLRFRMPRNARLAGDPLQRRAGIAVGDIRVVRNA